MYSVDPARSAEPARIVRTVMQCLVAKADVFLELDRGQDAEDLLKAVFALCDLSSEAETPQ
jgi:hypothetical protein